MYVDISSMARWFDQSVRHLHMLDYTQTQYQARGYVSLPYGFSVDVPLNSVCVPRDHILVGLV